VSFLLRKKTVLLGIVFVLLCAAFLIACGPSKQAKNAKRYKFTGRVVSIDKQNKSIIVDGDDIPGFMSAMTMPYQVKNSSDLDKVATGDSIAAEIVGQDNDYWLENIQVTKHPTTPPAKPSASLHIPESGEQVPDFELVNQNGKRISLNQYRGKTLILTFFYTRCPFPDFCPRVTHQFAEINRDLQADAALKSKTHLLSISFDPKNDSPRALRNYAATYTKGESSQIFNYWEFAVTPEKELSKVANYFALTCTEENGAITHSLSTAVIGPDGRIFKWYHGNDWTSSELVKDAADALHVAS